MSSSAAVPQQHRSHRWTLTFALTSLVAVIFLLQSEGLTTRVIAVQDVISKKMSLRGIGGSGTSVEITADSVTEAVDEEAIAKKAEEAAAAAKKVEEEAAAKKAADEAAAAAKKAEEEAAAKKAAEEAAAAAKKAEEEAAAEAKKNECPSKCSARVEERTKRWGGDLLNMADVKRLATQARDKLVARLKVDYGEDNFAKIFEVNGKSRGRTAFLSANKTEAISTERFKRKLKMKILSVQKAIREEENVVEGCNCRSGTKELSRRNLNTEASGDNNHYAKMVWATGGHSSAAGHGNLFNESYTAFMEQAVSDVFGAIGINFEGRNYAMGGTSSGVEIALCSEAVFGTDPDVISWDYGMTDGNWLV